MEKENGVYGEEDPRIELGKIITAEIKRIVNAPELILEVMCGPGEEPFEIVALFTLVNTGGSNVEDIEMLINDRLLELLTEKEFEPYVIRPALEAQP